MRHQMAGSNRGQEEEAGCRKEQKSAGGNKRQREEPRPQFSLEEVQLCFSQTELFNFFFSSLS